MNQSLPKVIWTAWFQGLEDAPDVVKFCYDSWINKNPDWKVILITNENIKDYFNIENIVGERRSDISLQKYANLLRMNLLSKHGGVWTDPTCVCVKSLDEWIHEYVCAGFFAFRPSTKDRPLDNWFLASKKGCLLTDRFCEEHNRFWAENNFSNQNTKMREAIIRYFPRILRKKEHETTIWVSYFARKILRVYPYHIFGYHFAYHLATNAVSRGIFESTPYASSDVAHLAQNLSRQNADIKVISEAISKAYPPIQKLTWKEKIFQRDNIDELDYLALLFQK